MPDLPIMRPHLLASYLDNMKTFFRFKFPKASKQEREEFLEKYITKHCAQLQQKLKEEKEAGMDIARVRPPGDLIWPTMRMVKYEDPEIPGVHSYGNMTYSDEEDLLGYVSTYRDKIISPFGTFYETVDKNTSTLKGMVDIKGKQRKAEKKLMLKAKKEGNKTAATFHNNNQATIKINMNSLIGAMGSGFSFLSSIANFNSVTSIARFFVMSAYAHAERFLESNFYFRTEEQLINFLMNCEMYAPSPVEVLQITRRYKFYVPTWEDVYSFLTGCLKRYVLQTEFPLIKEILTRMHPGMITFIFYMSNMHHLVRMNSDYFIPWIKDFFDYEQVKVEPIEEDEVYKIDGDLMTVLITVCNGLLPINEKGNSVTLYDLMEKEFYNPELVQRLVCIAKHMQAKMDEIKEIFELFMNHQVGIGYVTEHKQMFRDTVILSDTDSIIFTTQSWVKWYKGNLQIEDLSYNINALLVYWLCKANAFIMYNTSKYFGALNADRKTMVFKNEFMMPVEILTNAKKHYVNIQKIQEGVFFGKPPLDIKGVGLRGSGYSKRTLNYVTWFIQDIVNELCSTGQLKMRPRIVQVLQFERMILDDLRDGNVSFLPIKPIKNESEYRNAEASLYYNYQFWEALFGERYGHILIPSKCYILPLTNPRHFKYTMYLQKHYPDICEKLNKFILSNPSRPITRIPINPLTNQIPEELKPVIHYKVIIFTNAQPLYLILSSFGIQSGNGAMPYLFSDTYGWLAERRVKAVPYTEEK